MGKFVISESFLYKHRYLFGYGLIIIALIASLFLVGVYLPGGLSNQEMQSIVDANKVNITSVMNTSNIINLPYYFLQHLSILLFGVSIITIKLPSLFLALLSVIGMIIILRKWFKPRIGVLAMLIAITTGQFLFIAQDGTANILYLFWPVCLLLLATMVSFSKKLKWLYITALFVVSGLSLYTPLSIYLLITMLVVALLHPRLRYILKNTPRVPMIVGIILFAIIISPLANAVLTDINYGLILAGIPTSTPNFNSNLITLGAIYFGFSKPGGMSIMTPFFELGSMLIILIGVFNVIKTGVTAKNYIIISWTICLIPLIILNPNITTITFLPLVLLLATGLSATLNYWYKLFPNNPYARIGGLIPVIVLVSVLVYSGASRFVYGYEYDPDIVTNFSNDLELIPKNTKYILATNSETPFYQVIEKHNDGPKVINTPEGEEFLSTRKAKSDFINYKIDKIVTSSFKDDSDRFYLYKKVDN